MTKQGDASIQRQIAIMAARQAYRTYARIEGELTRDEREAKANAEREVNRLEAQERMVRRG